MSCQSHDSELLSSQAARPNPFYAGFAAHAQAPRGAWDDHYDSDGETPPPAALAHIQVQGGFVGGGGAGFVYGGTRAQQFYHMPEDPNSP